MNKFTARVERFIKTDINYLIRGGFWLTVGRASESLIGLVLAIGFGNWLPKVAYGNYRYILSLFDIISAISLTGMKTAVVQSVSRGFEGTLRAAFKTKMLWSLGMVAVALGGGAYYWVNDNTTLAVSLLFIAIFSPFIESAKLYGNFLIGKKSFRILAVYSTFYKLVPAIVLLAVIFFTDNVLAVIVSYFISHAIVLMWLYFLTIRKYQDNNKVDNSALMYGKKLSVINAFLQIVQHIDQVIVFTFLGATQLAVYNFSILLPNKIKGFLGTASYLALPKFSERDVKEIVPGLFRKALLMLAGSLAIIGLYILLAPFIFSLFLPQYKEAIFYSQVASLLIIGGVTSVISAVFFAHKKTKLISALGVGQSVIKLLLLCVLGYWLGLLGIVIAQVISQWIELISYGVAVRFLN